MKILFAFLLFSKLSTGQIALYVADKFDGKIISEIQKQTKRVYKTEVDSIGNFCKPEKQTWGYEASDFITCLSELKADYNHVIGLTTDTMGRLGLGYDFLDINFFYMPLYGHTSENMIYSIVSSAMDSTATFTVSTALHEIGHELGLNHCNNDKCIMFTYGPNDSLTLCKKCKRKYRRL